MKKKHTHNFDVEWRHDGEWRSSRSPLATTVESGDLLDGSFRVEKEEEEEEITKTKMKSEEEEVMFRKEVVFREI